MNRIHRKHHMCKLALLAAAATAFMATPAFAYEQPLGSGDGVDPAQQVRLTHASSTMSSAADASAATPTDPTYTYSPVANSGPFTREQVRAELQNWRNAGLLHPGGDIGDTEQTLAARHAYNEMQVEAITARWADETQRMVKARETEYAAQLARAEMEAVLAANALERPIDTAALASGNGTGVPGDVATRPGSGAADANPPSSTTTSTGDLPSDTPSPVPEAVRVQPAMSEPPQGLPARR